MSESTAAAGAGKQALPQDEPLQVPVEPGGAVSGSDTAHQDVPDDADAEPAQGSDDPELEGEIGNGASLVHVPVKRKGSRKR